jgi:hypothetical protein
MIITSTYSLGQLLLVRNHQDHEYYPVAHNFHLQQRLAAANNPSSIPYFHSVLPALLYQLGCHF